MIDFLKEIVGDDLFGQVSSKVTEYNSKNADKPLNAVNLTAGGYVASGKYVDLEKKYNILNTDHTKLKEGKTLDAQLADNYAALQKNYDTLSAEHTQTKRVQSVLGKKVNPQYAEFVAYEAGKLVSDTVDFDKALDGYLVKNPAYKGVSNQQPQQKVSTSPKFGGGTNTESNANAAMNNMLLMASGRKPKE